MIAHPYYKPMKTGITVSRSGKPMKSGGDTQSAVAREYQKQKKKKREVENERGAKEESCRVPKKKKKKVVQKKKKKRVGVGVGARE